MKFPKYAACRLYLLGLVLAGLLIPGPIATSQDGNGNGNGNGKKKNSSSGASATATTYVGQATVIKATVAGVTTTICDTGALPSEGGALEASLISANVAGLVSANVCHAATIGQGTSCKSEASMESLTLTVGGLYTINCGFAMSRARADCDANGNASVSGCSEISALSVNQVGIAITGAVNQENVAFLGLRIIINEQVSSVDGECGEITVTALHVILTDMVLGTTLADVVICRSHAGICCGGADGPHAEVRDFLTGGGFITGTPSGAKGNFGIAGGIKNGAFWGHLNYIDHGTGMHVKHETITGYDVTGPNERRITGTCRIDGVSGYTFSVFAADNGEPGNNDTFNIFLSTGYSAGGYLGGGNIQLHK